MLHKEQDIMQSNYETRQAYQSINTVITIVTQILLRDIIIHTYY